MGADGAHTDSRGLSLTGASRSKEVRKAIARVLTVMNQTIKDHSRAFHKDQKYKPLDLRPKKTRAIRRRLTPKQLAKKTSQATKRAHHFPLRKYALRV